MWRKLVVVVVCMVVLCSCVIAFNPEYREEVSQRAPLMLELNVIEDDDNDQYDDVFSSNNFEETYGDYPSNEILLESLDFEPKKNFSTVLKEPSFQPWSILWYAGSFGGLIAFFVVVSCSEWCCRAQARGGGLGRGLQGSTSLPDSPPPSYDLFAPPSYESLCSVVTTTDDEEKNDLEVYVVPVPPSVTTTLAIVPRSAVILVEAEEPTTATRPCEVLVDVSGAEREFYGRQVKESATQT